MWFEPTPFARGPWDLDACHAGPPTALMVRASERSIPEQRLVRMWVDLLRPVPMAGFRVEAEVERRGRTASRTMVRLLDDDAVYAVSRMLHLRALDDLDVDTAEVPVPDFASAVPGPFPIQDTMHGEQAFPSSLDVRYDPSASQGGGGPTVMWMRTVPILADEEPSGAQLICPLADSGNGISYNGYLDRVTFINPDLQLSLAAQPQGEWFCSSVRSHWQPDGTGLTEAVLFDRRSFVGLATQSLLLTPSS